MQTFIRANNLNRFSRYTSNKAFTPYSLRNNQESQSFLRRRNPVDGSVIEPQVKAPVMPTNFAGKSQNYEESLQRVRALEQKINNQSKAGIQLVKNVEAIVEEKGDIFGKKQRYDLFITKMTQLRKNEQRFKMRSNLVYKRMQTAPAFATNPIKEILKEYNDLIGSGSRGFDCEVMAQSMEHLENAIMARGNMPKATFMDYSSLSEMDQSWRMQKIQEDLKFALQRPEHAHFSGKNMSRVSRSLANIGYKNTQLLDSWLDRINEIASANVEQKEETVTEMYHRAVYGAPFKNFESKHYIYKGFETDGEFKEHMNTLLTWKDDKPKRQYGDQDVIEIEEAMQKLVNAADSLKDLQVDQQAAIESIRSQFFALAEANNKHEFLQESPYLKYDLLELEIILIEGGFLNSEEAIFGQNQKHAESNEEQMTRAAKIFHEKVLAQNPELVSPQYDAFYNAGATAQEELPEALPRLPVLSMSNLASTLIGLNEQALSIRRDVHDQDYPNEFYESYCMPEERMLVQSPGVNSVMSEAHKGTTLGNDVRKEHVMMERSYLKGWQMFMKKTENLHEYIAQQVNASPDDLQEQISAFGALTAIKFEDKKLRDQIMKNAIKMVNLDELTDEANGHSKDDPQVFRRRGLDTDTLIDALYGMAGCAYKPEGHGQLVNYLSSALNDQLNENDFTYNQTINLLYALEMDNANLTGICKLQCNCERRVNALKARLVEKIDYLCFERTTNELKYAEVEKLYDIYASAKHNGSPTFTNAKLVAAMESRTLKDSYMEHQSAFYDPLKTQLVSGIAAGLAKTNINMVHDTQKFDEDIIGSTGMYPYKPDLTTGWQGKKTGIFVLTNRNVMRDSNVADGFTRARLNTLEKAQADQNMVAVGIPIDSMCEYDLQEYKLALKKDFNLNKIVNEATGSKGQNFDALKHLATLTRNIAQNSLIMQQAANKPSVSQFIQSLTELLETKERVEQLYAPDQVLAGVAEVRFELLKFSLVHDTQLSELEKEIVREQLPVEFKSFDQFISNIKTNLPVVNSKAVKEYSWAGTRLGLELPKKLQQRKKQKSDYSAEKKIEVELLNRTFLWHEDYQHYGDWKALMEETYDNFNMLTIAPKKEKAKYFFDERLHNRRIPVGIIPNPNSIREPVSLPNRLVQNKKKSHNDKFVKFEADPHRDMINREKVQQLKPITSDVSMICNLQNMKQGMKSDFTDVVLTHTLMNLEFTDSLIDEHLSNQTSGQEAPAFVPRDASEFRKFTRKTQPSRNTFQSQHDHWYMNETKEDVKASELHAQIQAIKKQDVEDYTTTDTYDLQKQMDDILLAKNRENEDNFSLSHALTSRVKINSNLQSLMQTQTEGNFDLIQEGMSDEEFLSYRRRVAETTLIKSKIMYKLHKDLDLTASEKKYLNVWTGKATQAKDCLLGNQTMVPSTESKLKISSMSAEDMYTLNAIPHVELKREEHGNYALNDVVLELSHFLDQDTIRNVELTCLEDSLRKEWELSHDFKLVDCVNKEAIQLSQELEEKAWLLSGKFNDQDVSYIKEMISVKRVNKDHFEDELLDLDMQSLDNFLKQIENQEDKINLLENWITRKEVEFANKVNLPSPDMKYSDQELFAMLDAPLKKAREHLVANLLSQDERGVAVAPKPYDQMTTRELHLISENLSVRLNMFYEQQKGPSDRYPAFLPQTVKAIMEHPNLANSDRNLLDTYCFMFELDWRGDRTMKNQDQFLFHNPVYMQAAESNLIDGVVANQRLRKASVPFFGPLVDKMFKSA